MTTSGLENALREHVQREEAFAFQETPPADSLWGHLCRTARIAEQLGREEGLDPGTCRLGALFHDAGKFHNGQLHGDDVPEEQRSVEVFTQLARMHGLDETLVAAISEAILELYRSDPDPSPLARVLFDADNLEKLGALGVANFFVKRGLRGGGLTPSFMIQCTVELTYARHAVACMQTGAGRRWAARRAPQTQHFFRSLIQQLREDGLADLEIERIELEGLVIDAVRPTRCECGKPFAPWFRQEHGIKCHKIHLVHACETCGERYEVRFCRPRLPEA